MYENIYGWENAILPNTVAKLTETEVLNVYLQRWTPGDERYVLGS